MTLTVNGLPASPGCYVDGHWGQYAGGHLLEQAIGLAEIGSPLYLLLGEIYAAWPKESDGSLVGAYGSERDAEQGKGTGPWAALQNFGDTDGQIAMELAEQVLVLLNENTEGGYWEWWEGEVYLRSFVCPECGRDARVSGDERASVRDATGTVIHWIRWDPCPYCCDADDPGAFS